MNTGFLPLPTLRAPLGVPHNWWVFAGVYLLVWVFMPPLLAPSFPLDVVESLGWGREWQWGYYKHPPLPPIALHVFYQAFGRIGPFALSQLCVALTLWMVWLTARRLVSPERALLGSLLTMGVAFYTRPTLEFNHNIAQMPLWAAICYYYLAAWQDGKLRQWCMLGLFAGLGLLCKYSMGVLLVCLALFTAFTPARRVLRQPGPWLAMLVMTLVFAPHLVWLQHNDWLPLAYAHERTSGPGTPAQLGALKFALTQGLNHLPLLLILLLPLTWLRLTHQLPRTAARQRIHSQQPHYLLLIAMGPGLLLVLLGLLAGVRLRDMWGVPIWPFSGLLLVALLPDAKLARLRPIMLRGLALWLVLITILSGLYLFKIADWRQRPVRSDWPTAALAQQAEHTWAELSICPLDTVAGDTWMASLIATSIANHPSVLIPGDARYSPWATPQRLLTHGALWVWQSEDTDDGEPTPIAALTDIQSNLAIQVHQGRWSIPWAREPHQKALEIEWRTMVPMACIRNPAEASNR